VAILAFFIRNIITSTVSDSDCAYMPRSYKSHTVQIQKKQPVVYINLAQSCCITHRRTAGVLGGAAALPSSGEVGNF